MLDFPLAAAVCLLICRRSNFYSPQICHSGVFRSILLEFLPLCGFRCITNKINKIIVTLIFIIIIFLLFLPLHLL